MDVRWRQVRAVWWVVEDSKMKTVIYEVFCVLMWGFGLCGRKLFSISGQTLSIHTSNFHSNPMLHSQLMVTPAGMNSECTTQFMSQSAVSWTLPVGEILNFFGDGKHFSLLITKTEIMHPAFTPVPKSNKNSVSSYSYCNSNCQQIFINFSFCSLVGIWRNHHTRETIIHDFWCPDLQLVPTPADMKQQFFHCCLRNTIILLDSFFNVI
jgi:hypothetical protein